MAPDAIVVFCLFLVDVRCGLATLDVDCERAGR